MLVDDVNPQVLAYAGCCPAIGQSSLSQDATWRLQMACTSPIAQVRLFSACISNSRLHAGVTECHGTVRFLHLPLQRVQNLKHVGRAPACVRSAAYACAGALDGVLCIALLHHISTVERRLAMLAELARVLRCGGHAIVTVWASEQEQPGKLAKWEPIGGGTSCAASGEHQPVMYCNSAVELCPKLLGRQDGQYFAQALTAQGGRHFCVGVKSFNGVRLWPPMQAGAY